MVERKQYLQELKQWKDDDVIKVVTGLRRCGKSTLLAQFQNWLLENGIENEQIISINFEELEYEDLLDYKKLYAYIKERLAEGKMTYMLVLPTYSIYLSCESYLLWMLTALPLETLYTSTWWAAGNTAWMLWLRCRE